MSVQPKPPPSITPTPLSQLPYNNAEKPPGLFRPHRHLTVTPFVTQKDSKFWSEEQTMHLTHTIKHSLVHTHTHNICK